MQKITSVEGFKWNEVIEEMGRNETDRVYGQTGEEDVVNHLRRHREAELADEAAYFKELQVQLSARPSTTLYDKEVAATLKAVSKKNGWTTLYIYESRHQENAHAHACIGSRFQSGPFLQD